MCQNKSCISKTPKWDPEGGSDLAGRCGSHLPLWDQETNPKKLQFNVFCLVFCWQLHREPQEQSSSNIAGTAVSIMDFSVHLENKTELFCVDLKHFFHYNERKGAKIHLQSTATSCLTQNESFHFVFTVLNHFLIHTKLKTKNIVKEKGFASTKIDFLTPPSHLELSALNARGACELFWFVFELHGKWRELVLPVEPPWPHNLGWS